MKKKHVLLISVPSGWWESQLCRKMRVLLILLIICVSHTFALDGYSQNKRLSLNMSNVSIKNVLGAIEDQTEFYFMYEANSVDVEKKVNLSAENKTVPEILNELFENTHITYKISNRQIALSNENSASTQQQSKTITGRVTDSSGNPLPGVSVVVVGTTKGVVTDIDGNYSIGNLNDKSNLEFSFIGMQSQTILVGKVLVINVKLTEATVGLDEVIAIGYGTTTKRKMVSSISTITTEKMTEIPYASVINGLAGSTPGLFVAESGGEYGSVPVVSIRGGGEPTYVIDGIMASKSEFALVPANDIEKISFLKDAAACAVYGFNSANGIVLVTTKKGGKDKIRFNYSGNFASQSPTLIPEYMSPYELAEMKNKIAFNDGLPAIVDQETMNILKNNLDPVKYPTYSAFDEAVKKSAMQRSHNISMDGTINKTSIFMSLDYFGQDGIYNTNDYGLNRYSYRSNISHTFDNIGLQVEGSMTLQRNVKKSPSMGIWEIWSHVRNWAVGTPLYNPEGNYTGLENPLAEADSRGGYNNEELNRVNGRLAFTWDVPRVKGLTLKAIGNFRVENEFDKSWASNQRYSAPTYSWSNQMDDMGKPSLSEGMGRTYNYDLEGHINYLRTFAGKHTVELTGVYSQSEARYDGFSAYRKDFVSPAVDELFAGSEVGKSNSGNASESGRVGYIGRVKYDYSSRYVLEGNFRYDGYDAFAKGHQYKMFPSMSFGWNIDQEAFAKPIMDKIRMNAFKLRFSWGSLGKLGQDDNEINAYRFSHLAVYNLVNNAYYLDGSWRTGFSEGPLTSSAGTSTWYTVNSKNLGLDFAFMDNKISGSVDWFYYRTTGYLGSPRSTYTTPLGKDLPRVNTNSAHRRGGIELSLNYKAQIGRVKLNVGGNISYYDQLWERKFDEDSTSLKNPYKRLTHQKDYYTIGYINEGYYQSLDEILRAPRRLGSTETMPGDLKYQDFNGDGRLDGDDQVRIGKSSFAHVVYGITLDASYKGFNINAMFQGTGNRQMYLGGMWQNELNHMIYTVQNDYWRADNTNSLFPRASSFNNINGGNNTVTSTFWMLDAWYLRLKSLALSYDLKTSLLRNFKQVDRFSIILSATNVFTISPVTKYYLDPETSSSDNYGYPVSRTLNLGVRIAF